MCQNSASVAAKGDAMTKGAPVVVGLVGARFAASLHAANYRRVYGVEVRVKGVTSRRPERDREFARTNGLERSYRDLGELLADSEVNLVDVCAPNLTHKDVCVAALRAGKNVICEKPMTGYFGDGEGFRAEGFPRRRMLEEALAGADQILEAERGSEGTLMYGENWVYSPPVQKANALVARGGGAIMRIVGEESHSGSHSSFAKEWRFAGGGSLLNKGCHPLGATLYLKAEEGVRRGKGPIRPREVVAAVGNLTRMEAFEAESPKHIATGWNDCEDWGSLLLKFDDGSVAQITSTDTLLGGIQNVLSVHTSRSTILCNINPNTSVVAYAPDSSVFEGEYLREKQETTEGWSFVNPDEDWITGYPQELQDFCEAVAFGRPPKSGSALARDVIAVCYGAYLSAAEGRMVELAPYL